MIASRFRGRDLDGKPGRKVVECGCGSGRPSTPQYSANNQFLFRTCKACHSVTMMRYREQLEKEKQKDDGDGTTKGRQKEAASPKDSGGRDEQ